MRTGRTCGYACQRQNQPQIAAQYDSLKEQLKAGMQDQLKNSGPEVKDDYGKQNGFYAKVSGALQNCEQYEDELTQAIALSVVPENIVAMGGNPVA